MDGAVSKRIETERDARALTSLTKALTLLLRLREASKPMGLSEISRDLNINKATVFRLLVTLERFQFVERNVDDKKYRVGINAFYVGNGFFAARRQEAIRQMLQNLAGISGHTVTMSVLDGTQVVFINRADGDSRVRVAVEVGSRVPAYASASGKILLAGLSDEEVKARFKAEGFKRWTPRTVRSVQELLADLARVRQRGVAFNNEESSEGLCALSVPIKSEKRSHLAALTVAFPAGTLTDKDQWKLAQSVTTVAAGIEKLGLGD